MAGWARGAARGLLVLGALGYPFLVWWVLTRWGPLALAGVLAVGVIPGLVAALRARASGSSATRPLAPALAVLALIVLSIILRESGWLLLTPVVINLSLAFGFGRTLWKGPPLIERFARLQHPELSSAELAWCRLWTRIWTFFLLGNAAVAGSLAVWAPMEVWVAYTGGVAYALVGLPWGLPRELCPCRQHWVR